MGNSMIIGQYVPGNSFIHKLDPRTKMIIIFFYVIFVFFANNTYSYTLLTLFVLFVILTTRIPFRFIIKGLLPICFLIVFIFLFHFFFVFFSNNTYIYTLLMLFVLFVILTTRIPFRFIIKGLLPIWFLIVFTFLLHVFLTKTGPVLYEFMAIKIHLGGVIQGLVIS